MVCALEWRGVLLCCHTIYRQYIMSVLLCGSCQCVLGPNPSPPRAPHESDCRNIVSGYFSEGIFYSAPRQKDLVNNRWGMYFRLPFDSSPSPPPILCVCADACVKNVGRFSNNVHFVAALSSSVFVFTFDSYLFNIQSFSTWLCSGRTLSHLTRNL